MADNDISKDEEPHNVSENRDNMSNDYVLHTRVNKLENCIKKLLEELIDFGIELQL